MAGISDKHFNAILAKNSIAREIRGCRDGETISTTAIVSDLKIIEEWIGQANQPSIEEILTSERKDI